MILIGRISECEPRIHMGDRSALNQLTDTIKTTRDPTALNFAKSTLATTSEGYDTFFQKDKKERYPLAKPLEYLRTQAGESPSKNLHDVVVVIDTDQNLNAVAVGFIAFRQMTGENVKMFDFAAVKSWCSQHQPQCQ
jgi:hypothetical protein